MWNISCNSSADKIYYISLEKAISGTTKLEAENCIDSIKYIQLETNSNCFIGNISKILRWKNYLYVCDWEDHLYLFNLSGKYIHTIGSKGRGPGEYIAIGDLLLNPNNGDISILTMGKMLVYGLDGLLKKELTINPAFQVGVMKNNGNMIFISPTKQGPVTPLLNICNTEGKVVKEIYGNSVKTKLPMSFFNWIYEKDNVIYFKEEFSDTLRCMHQDYSSYPYAIIDLGKYAFKPSLFNFEYENEWIHYYRLLGVWDFNNTMLLKVQKGLYGNDYTSFFYCKDSDIVGTLGDCYSKEGFVIDEIFYTPVSGHKNQLISWISASSLIDNDKISSPVLAKITKSISLESNPVIAILYMK